MGLFDFALRPGQRFNKEELRILDKNFNSISAYTKRKFRFERKDIADDINGSHYGVDNHRVTYIHIDTQLPDSDPNQWLQFDCLKLFIKTEGNYHAVKEFFDSSYDDGFKKIKVPVMKKFPTFALKVGWGGNGFITEFKYNSDNIIDRTLDNPYLSDKCIKEIETNSIKFLKKI